MVFIGVVDFGFSSLLLEYCGVIVYWIGEVVCVVVVWIYDLLVVGKCVVLVDCV